MKKTNVLLFLLLIVLLIGVVIVNTGCSKSDKNSNKTCEYVQVQKESENTPISPLSLVFFPNGTYYYHHIAMSYLYCGYYKIEDNKFVLDHDKKPFIVLKVDGNKLIVEDSFTALFSKGTEFEFNENFNPDDPGYYSMQWIEEHITGVKSSSSSEK